MFNTIRNKVSINDCRQTHRSAAINLKYWLDFTPTLCLSYFNLSFTNLNLHEQVRRIFSLQHFSIFCSTKLIKVFLFTKFLLTFFLKKCGHKFYSVSTLYRCSEDSLQFVEFCNSINLFCQIILLTLLKP